MRLKFVIGSLCFSLLFLFASFSAQATHLVGGSINYKYLGKNNNDFDIYEISLYIYRDCTSATPLDQSASVGFYEASSANPSIYTIVSVPLTKSTLVDPVSNTDCDFNAKVCLQEGYYAIKIVLPPSKYGYHMQHYRCCRNTMVNVPIEEGFAYYGFIAPSSLKNSAPVFSDVPAPFVCLKDTVSLVNSAKDPDGDSLVYKLSAPLTGGDKNNPSPGPPNKFTIPKSVNYNPGYNYLKPFGKDGYINIDPISGITKIYIPAKGLYVYAVEVEEYRNGNLISVTRRDIQVIVTDCPVNPSPVRIPVNNSTQTVFNLTSGEKFSYPFRYYDANGLKFTYSSDMFDSTLTYPAAKLTHSFSNDLKTLDGRITWDIACNQARNSPYHVTLKVQDDGCPPKVYTEIFSIYVRPFVGIRNIFGPTLVCWGEAAYEYNVVRTQKTSQIKWMVTNGTIDNDTAATVHIVWDKTSSGTIKVVEISGAGCPGDTITKTVAIADPPHTSEIKGPIALCLGDTNTYFVDSTAGSTYKWFITNGNFIKVSNNSTVHIFSNTDDTITLKVIETDAKGCIGDTIEKTILVSMPKADSIYGSISVCPNAKNIDYWTDYQEGSTYEWEIIGGIKVSGGNGFHIKVNWGEKGGGIVKVKETTLYGCPSDTITLKVLKDYVLYTPPIIGDSSVCEFSKLVGYQTTHSNGSTYDWQISGGSIVSGNGTYKVIVDWDTKGKGILMVTETAYDSINKTPCIGIPVAKVIDLNPLPLTKSVNAPASMCAGDTINFSVEGYEGSWYLWTLDNNANFSGNDSTDSIFVTTTIAGKHQLKVFEVTKDSCLGNPVIFNFMVNPIPVTSEIIGSNTACAPDLENIVYKVNGFDGSVYNWTAEGGTIVSGQGTEKVVINWLTEGDKVLKVVEVSGKGCQGEEKVLNIKVDSLFFNLRVVSTKPDNHKQIQLHWDWPTSPYFTGKTYIYRTITGNSVEYFQLIDSVDLGVNTYIDKNAKTDVNSYYYKVGGFNVCNKLVTSSPHRSILLNGSKLNDSTVTLSWNEYLGWRNGVKDYDILRNLNESFEYHTLRNLKDTQYWFYTHLEGYNQCFRIVASNFLDTFTSLSNIVCLDFDPYLYIPNAFSPGNDDINEQFKVFVSNYKSYNISIYNRWGEHVFESNDPSKSWDGTYKGKKCPEGVYLYIVYVDGAKEKIYRKGTLHLIK